MLTDRMQAGQTELCVRTISSLRIFSDKFSVAGCCLCIVAFLCFIMAISPSAFGSERVQRTTVIYDFSTPSQLALWETSDYAEIRAAEAWDEVNDGGAVISFQHASPSAGAAGVAEAPIEIIRDSDQKLSDYDFLAFDIQNPGNERLFFNFGLRAGERRRSVSHIDLHPGEKKTYRISLREFPVTPGPDNIGRFLSGDEADGLFFSMGYPPGDFSVRLKSIRLVQDPGYPLDGMISKLRGRREEFGELTGQIDFDYYGHLLAEGNGAAALQTRLDSLLEGALELRDRHLHDSSFTWNKIEKVRRETDVLQEQKEEFNLDWNLFCAVAHASARGGGNVDFVLAVESPLRKVFLEKDRFGSEFPPDRRYRLHAARNESESFQAVIFPLERDLKDVTWELSDLRNDDGGTIPASVRVVGYVRTRLTDRARSSRIRDGWWPDPLLEHPEAIEAIPADEVVPLWITVEVPEDAAAGVYSGELTVNAGKTTQAIAVDLKVLDLTLPRRSSLVSVNQFNHGAYGQWCPPSEPEESHEERTRQTRERIDNWLLKYRMQPGTIYAGSPPDWDVERLKDLVERGLNAINLAYIAIHRRHVDDYDEEEFWNRLESQVERIKEYIPVLREAGVLANEEILLYIHLFDEWPGRQIDIVHRAAERLKSIFPAAQLATTAFDSSYGVGHERGDFIDIWIPHGGTIASNRMHINQAREENRDFWWYFAVGSYAPYINYYWLENPTIEGRIAMGAMTYKYDKSGFLYWNVHVNWARNTADRLDAFPRTRWDISWGHGAAHGEGSLMYVYFSDEDRKRGLGATPLASIRMESYRDGMEDYEYYVKLERLRRETGVSSGRVPVPGEIVHHAGDFTDDPAVLKEHKLRMADEIIRLRGRSQANNQ